MTEKIEIETKPFDLFKFLSDPVMMGSGFAILAGTLLKAAKDPEKQKRLESLISTLADAAQKLTPMLPYIVGAWFGYGFGMPGTPRENQTVGTRLGGAGLGVLGVELVKSPNLAAGAAGVGVLASISSVEVIPFLDQMIGELGEWWNEIQHPTTVVTVDGRKFNKEDTVLPTLDDKGKMVCPVGFELAEIGFLHHRCVPFTSE